MKKLILMLIICTGLYAVDDKECCDNVNNFPQAFLYPEDKNLRCSNDTSVFGEYLLFHFFEEGLEYTAVSGRNRIRYNRLSWNSGFRIGARTIIKNLSYIAADWTYLKLKKDNNVQVNDNTIFGTLLPPDDVNYMNSASSRFSSDFNTLDVYGTATYHISRYFISEPAIGIRAAWIDQDYHTRYSISSQKNNVFIKNDYWGVGLRTSYKGKFILSNNYSLYSSLLGSLLFSKFDVSQNSQVNSNFIKYKEQKSEYQIIPNMELALGLLCSRYFNNDKSLISLKIAYEFHNWRNLNQIYRFFNQTNPSGSDITSRGNLAMNGFIFGLNVYF